MYVKQSNLFLFGLIVLIGVSGFFLNQNASAQVSIDPASIYYNDSGNYVPYKLLQNSNNDTIITKDGSFVFNKNTCAISFYDSKGTTLIGSDSYSVLASQGNSGVWNPVSIINNAACSTNINENHGTVTITGSKSVIGAGVFSINYTKAPLQPLKLTFSATNQNPSWTNYHIGLEENIQVPKNISLGNQTYDLSQHNGTVLNRAWISSHNSQLLSLTNNLRFNMGLGWNNVNQVTVNWIGDKAYLKIDYTYNTPILSPGNTITVDPNIDTDSSVTSNVASTNATQNISITIGNNNNRLLVVTSNFRWESAAAGGISSVKLGSLSFTKAIAKTNVTAGTDEEASIWYLKNPPVGAQHITITPNATSSYRVIAQARSLYNTDSTTPIGALNTNSGTGTAVSVSLTPTKSGSWIQDSVIGQATLSLPSNTQIYNVAVSWSGASQYNSTPTIGSSNTLSWTMGSGDWVSVAAEIRSSNTPAQTTLIKVNTINSTAINATWNSSTGATWYQLNKTSPNGGTMSQYANVTTLFKVVTGLTPGTQYQFTVSPGNSSGTGAGSIKKFNYTFNVAPTIPTLSSITNTQMRLGWTNPGGGANLTGGFNIYKVSGVGTNYTKIQTTNNTNHYDPTSLQGNREYTFKLATRYAVGSNYTGASANTTTVSAYTLPSPPTSLTSTQTVPLSVHLVWVAATGDNGTQSGYLIEQSNNGGATWITKIANTGNATVNANITESSAGNFKFRVSSIRYGGTSSPSNVATLTVYDLFTVREYHADGITPVYGQAIQANSTSSNNRFTLVSGAVTISGISGNNNFTAWNSLINFIVGKQYNYNATANHSLNMTTNDYDIDCTSTGVGVDVELWTNGTNGHRITTFTTPTCYTNNTVKWSTKFTANGNDPHTYTTLVYVKAVNATFGTVAPLKYNNTIVGTAFTNPYIISDPVTVGTGLQTKLFNWSMNLTVSPAFTPVNFTVGHISVSGVNPVTVPIKFATTAINSSATAVTVSFPSTFTMGYNVTFGNEGVVKTYTGLPVTSPTLGTSQSVITFKNPANDFVTIKAYDLTSKTSGSYIMSQPNTNVPFVTQFTNFKNGLFGTSAMIGGINIIDLIVLIVAMIGLNRANEIVGAFMMVIIVGVAGFFQIITWPTAMVSGIALAVLVTVVTMKKYQNS